MVSIYFYSSDICAKLSLLFRRPQAVGDPFNYCKIYEQILLVFCEFSLTTIWGERSSRHCLYVTYTGNYPHYTRQMDGGGPLTIWKKPPCSELINGGIVLECRLVISLEKKKKELNGLVFSRSHPFFQHQASARLLSSHFCYHSRNGRVTVETR